MADAKAAERACRDPNPIIDGRKANVNLAYLGAKPRGKSEKKETKKNNRPNKRRKIAFLCADVVKK